MIKHSSFRTIFFPAALALAGILAFSTGASAQNRGSASASAEAKIVAGISIEKVLDLNFGTIVRSINGGSVTINPQNGQISYNGVTQGQNTTHQIAQFKTTGEADYLYTISLPQSATLDLQGGGQEGKQTMTVTNFTYTNGAGKLDKKGTEEFKVGGTLNVNPNQATGRYTGSFEVSVQYQ